MASASSLRGAWGDGLYERRGHLRHSLLLLWCARAYVHRYYELLEKDVIKFGTSTREYVLLHERSDA